MRAHRLIGGGAVLLLALASPDLAGAAPRATLFLPPTIALAPNCGPEDTVTSVHVVGRGFVSNQPVVIAFNPGETEATFRTAADGNGQVDTTIQAYAVPAGVYVVEARPVPIVDIEVQLLHGPVGANEELRPAAVVTMELVGLDEPGPADGGDAKNLHRYSGSFVCERAGRYGFAVRVVPSHPDLPSFAELGCVAWAAG